MKHIYYIEFHPINLTVTLMGLETSKIWIYVKSRKAASAFLCVHNEWPTSLEIYELKAQYDFQQIYLKYQLKIHTPSKMERRRRRVTLEPLSIILNLPNNNQQQLSQQSSLRNLDLHSHDLSPI